MEIGLSIGSNLGDRLGNLRRARFLVGRLPGIRIVAKSGVYETEPVSVPDEFRELAFLNAVLIVESRLAPERLANLVAGVEHALGRPLKRRRNAPRVVDIDIIYAGEMRIRDARLTIPHPRWAGRRFVVEPLAELRPDAILPGRRRSVREILLSLPVRPKVLLMRRRW